MITIKRRSENEAQGDDPMTSLYGVAGKLPDCSSILTRHTLGESTGKDW